MVAGAQMISMIDINAICDELGTNPPKVVEYANCSAIIIRNGDGAKVLIVAEEGMSRESVKHRIAAAFKVKAENIASGDKLAEAFDALVKVGIEADGGHLLVPQSVEITLKPDIETHAKASHTHGTDYLSKGTLTGSLKLDPVTPAKEIRAQQEAKKPHNK